MKKPIRFILSVLMVISSFPALAERGNGRTFVAAENDGGSNGGNTPRLNNRAAQCALNKAKAFHRANKGKHRLSNVIVLIDYDAPANTQRMTIVNLSNGSVKRHTVAHGKGGINSRPGSKGSELGFMRFAETYHGKYGLSVRIDGLERDNRDARSRAIVLHGANYVREGGNAGRSWGCPAVDQKSAPGIIRQVKNGALLYSYRGNSVC